jgi:hypothetical protein
MKNKKEIIEIAKKHLIENPFPHGDYDWIFKQEFIELENEVYFDYTFNHKKNLPFDQWEMFGGAPGFCLNKFTGKVRDIGRDEFQESIKNNGLFQRNSKGRSFCLA